MRFQLSTKYKPAGDQPKAIKELVKGIKNEQKFQTLLGVTGSGKTFTIANVIAQIQKPTLVIAHNKTLAAQLTQEFRTFFPKNAVEYFVSYYDYYQPEAYLAASDTYIEKEAQINEEIDRLRHASTSALLSRKDVIIVASVSCIYGLGSPEYYRAISLELKIGEKIDREEIIRKLVEMQFNRSDILSRGKFRATGNVVEIMAPSREIVTRIELEAGKAAKIFEYDLLTGEELGKLNQILIYPAKHFVVPEPMMETALKEIEKEMRERVKYLRENDKLLEAQRLERRTKQDIEMMREVGYCNGIENYSRYLTGRGPGETPETLMDYFSASPAGKSGGFLTVVDESHVTLPQLRGMFQGDYSRKKSLVDNGFRLPSAFDNRPLKFSEWEKKIGQIIFTSATPADYELEKSRNLSPFGKGGSEGGFEKLSKCKNPSPTLPLKKGERFGIVEQIIRPTGLIDPELEIKSAKGQVKDVLEEIEKIVIKKERVLITTLTKKMAEDLAEFLKENKIKAEYLHSNVETLDRIRILEDLRRGKFDVLVGVNLLREGLDLPEVSLVAILDADKEGFLRSETSLIQTIGRAARNVSGRVILYADNITGSMKRAIEETNRRRKLQAAFNKKHRITPKTIKKKIQSIVDHEIKPEITRDFTELESLEDIAGYLKQREKEMKDAAKNLEFEKALVIRDEIAQLRKLQMK
ncbi:MAG: excinuclease ABC subunit UvrB [Candidatus Moranbacteria bacterium CG_4_9_14_3_um_filter_40_7]|nr:MAG: excinuclease ABC subunit UvrB [Candidatus Moranbacteria bacterium CG_4_9_14_3_um_filter_40_7]